MHICVFCCTAVRRRAPLRAHSKLPPLAPQLHLAGAEPMPSSRAAPSSPEAVPEIELVLEREVSRGRAPQGEEVGRQRMSGVEVIRDVKRVD